LPAFYFGFFIKLEGGEDMIVMFFAQRVIHGKTEYIEVPSVLQIIVKEILVESGIGFLVDGQ